MLDWNQKPENANDNNKKYGMIALMQKAGRDEKEIVNIFINLIVAGGETPALVCCKTLAAIVANPEVLVKALKEVDQIGELTDKNLD